jgi:putative SOS response-associated peptidase YedK
MCGRYTTAADRVKFDDIFKPAAVEQAVEKAVGRYNVAPTQQVAIIERTAEDDRHASTARWSLVPRWAKSIKERPQWINARSDKVLTSKLWRSLAARPEGRILIPADGWYEWMHAEQQRGGPKPAPFHHRVDDGGWFAFAGLRSRAHVEDVDEPLATIAIITTDAAGPAARLHDRMPVVLANADMMQAWLSPDLQLDDVPELLAPLAGDRITVHPASGLVNSARNDGPELLEPTVA